MNSLQYKWDVFLMTWFYKEPDRFFPRVAAEFVQRQGITYEQFNELKRTPKNPVMSKKTVSVFIGCFYPELANILYDRDITDVFDIADKLVRWSPRLKSNSAEARARRKKKLESYNAVRGRSALLTAVKIENQEHNRSNWSTCKPCGKR